MTETLRTTKIEAPDPSGERGGDSLRELGDSLSNTLNQKRENNFNKTPTPDKTNDLEAAHRAVLEAFGENAAPDQGAPAHGFRYSGGERRVLVGEALDQATAGGRAAEASNRALPHEETTSRKITNEAPRQEHTPASEKGAKSAWLQDMEGLANDLDKLGITDPKTREDMLKGEMARTYGGGVMMNRASSQEAQKGFSERDAIVERQRVVAHEADTVVHEAEEAHLLTAVETETREDGSSSIVKEGRLDDEVALKVEESVDGGEVGAVEVIIGDEPSDEHEIKIIEPDSKAPRIEIDGQPASPDEVETVNHVLEHVKEGLEEKAEKAPEDNQREAILTNEDKKRTDESTSRREASRELPQHKSKTPQERPATIERPGFDQVKANEAGKSFIQHYLRNPNIKESMQQAGINLSELSEKMQSGEMKITQETIRAMRDLNRVGPKSELWDAAPGDGSLVQRAANESRENLKRILSSL